MWTWTPKPEGKNTSASSTDGTSQTEAILEGSVREEQDGTNVDVETETGRQEHLRILH